MPSRQLFLSLPRWLPAPGLGLLAALPLLLRGPSCGQDFDFHLQSWLAVRAAWHAGLPAPHWVPAANYGAGEPRFVFYPPLSWLLGALLGAVLPWTLVPAAFTALCFAGAAASMRRLARPFRGPVAAWLAAVLYAMSPYLLFTGYERTAYGELLAAVWMPLLLAALLRPRLPLARVALLLAALWYTNAPAGVMGCYLVLFAMVWNATAQLVGFQSPPGAESRPRPALARSVFAPLLRGATALTLGCALAADYLLPAWYEQRFVAIRRAIGLGMRVQDSFLFGHTGEPYHDQVLRTASWIVVVTLAAGAAGAAGAAVMLWSHRRSRGVAGDPQSTAYHPAPHAGALLAALIVVFAWLQLRWSDPVWRLLPELAFLQFPWRWMLPASAAAALLAALALPRFGSRGRVALIAAGSVYALGLTTWAAQTRYQPCDDEDKVSAQLALLHNNPNSAAGAGFEGTDEYAAAGSDNGEIQRGLPRVRLLRSPDADEGDDSAGSDAANPAWKPEASGISGTFISGPVQVRQWSPEHLTVRLHPEADAYAVLRLERFPAWLVLLNSAPCGAACVARQDGLLTVHLPAHRWSTLDARYRTTGDVLFGRAISAVALLLLLALARRRASTQLS